MKRIHSFPQGHSGCAICAAGTVRGPRSKCGLSICSSLCSRHEDTGSFNAKALLAGTLSSGAVSPTISKQKRPWWFMTRRKVRRGVCMNIYLGSPSSKRKLWSPYTRKWAVALKISRRKLPTWLFLKKKKKQVCTTVLASVNLKMRRSGLQLQIYNQHPLGYIASKDPFSLAYSIFI